MTAAGVLTILLMLLGFVVLMLIMFAITLLAVAFIGAPDDINDVDIKGELKQK